jgi:hypothetical protein
MILRVLLSHMRHQACSGLPAKVDLLTGIERADGRPLRKTVLMAAPVTGFRPPP